MHPEKNQNCKWKQSPSAGKICSANQGVSALSTQMEKKRTVSAVILNNFGFCKIPFSVLYDILRDETWETPFCLPANESMTV